MKLNKKEKRRIELYIDMLEFNGDMRSWYSDEVILETIQKLNYIHTIGWYHNKEDKPMLTSLERKYHKHKVIIS
jgi:hypothetical protein